MSIELREGGHPQRPITPMRKRVEQTAIAGRKVRKIEPRKTSNLFVFQPPTPLRGNSQTPRGHAHPWLLPILEQRSTQERAKLFESGAETVRMHSIRILEISFEYLSIRVQSSEY